ncbi:MAG TPA: flavodoxin family protein [Desulfobacteraceae bacterium]|nr:flavodoxin family protein [Deltaproteobacteria bacterium]RLB98382.1 MAG: flavin reductase [Deltaproteobacteria bacterium]HDI61315.1 flavodoxin family protein [Desulfobacteraceae bacterium]
MLVLGLQGSPRRKGNTAFLLDLFLEEARRLGARTAVISPAREAIAACKGCGACEKRGFCVSHDVMAQSIYPFLRQADVVVAASPVYFYGVTAQLKGLIDRCQTLWSRKYRLKLADPGAATRAGVMLAVGATHGGKLFDGLHLTVDYFFDAIAARNAGSLTYRGVEHAGDMARHPRVRAEAAALARQVCGPLAARRRIVFSDPGGAGAGMMAAAWMRYLAGDKWNVFVDAPAPSGQTAAMVERVMAARGIDLGYAGIQPLASENAPMDRVVAIGSAPVETAPVTDRWLLEEGRDPADADGFARLCDEMRQKVARGGDGLPPAA